MMDGRMGVWSPNSSHSSRSSSILFGIHSESKSTREIKKARRHQRRITWIAVTTVFLITFPLISLVIYDISLHVRHKTERLIPEHLDNLTRLQLVNSSDVFLEADKRWDQVDSRFLNHKYEDEAVDKAGWVPRPFEKKEKRNRTVNNIQEILENSQPTFGMSRPVRFRGIYLHPTEELEEPNDEKNKNYYENINNYFQPNQSQLPLPTSQYDSIKTEPSNQIEFPARRMKKPKKKPFTVMLDIYPMTSDDSEAVYTQKRPKNTIFIPIRPGEEFFEPIMEPSQPVSQIMLPPRQFQKKGRMLMKLNLFPKNKKVKSQLKAKKRTFGFKNYEDDYYDDYLDNYGCNGIVGHNPFGKPITAKWKDKHGDFVHAKYVSLHQWDRSDRSTKKLKGKT